MDIFIPGELLDELFENWEDAPEQEFAEAIAATVEHSWHYFQWLLSVREHHCRLVVVQYFDQSKKEVYPHHQIGELFSLSQMHPEKAMQQAESISRDGEDGITFSMPFSKEIEAQIGHLAAAFDIPAEDADQLITGVLLLEMGHEDYLMEMNEEMFYIATRGQEKDIDELILSEHGGWTAEMMGIIDQANTASQTEVYATQPNDITPPVPLFCQFMAEDDDFDPEDTKDLRNISPASDTLN